MNAMPIILHNESCAMMFAIPFQSLPWSWIARSSVDFQIVGKKNTTGMSKKKLAPNTFSTPYPSPITPITIGDSTQPRLIIVKYHPRNDPVFRLVECCSIAKSNPRVTSHKVVIKIAKLPTARYHGIGSASSKTLTASTSVRMVKQLRLPQRRTKKGRISIPAIPSRYEMVNKSPTRSCPTTLSRKEDSTYAGTAIANENKKMRT